MELKVSLEIALSLSLSLSFISVNTPLRARAESTYLPVIPFTVLRST